MNKQASLIIAFAALAVAAGGISASVRANKEKALVQKKMDALLDKLNEQTVAPEPDPEQDAPLTAFQETEEIYTNKVASLLEELAANDAEIQRLRSELEALQNNPRPSRESFRDRMERMKEEDPERYAEMIQRRTEFQERIRDDQFNRLTALADVDTSHMTPEELANHTALLDKLSTMWEQTGEFDPENPPDREQMREIFGSMREIGDMMDQERTFMFRQLGSDVGLAGSEAEEFASYVESVIEATTMRPPRGMRGPRGGGN